MKTSGIALYVVLVLAVAEPLFFAAEGCVISELQPCASAIVSGTPPSVECCTNLKQQQPCFCQYLKDPSLGGYVKSPNAKKVARACGVSIPTNC
ncbi:non-specific lipid-transfer protein 2P-like [Olea europaea var. sylvestris]|uniref:non-specific lipid-transfer protein 2P-like n=1 Tax=Olea europaea var. sylvestris TaxID=158386 RepID=UPI000C1D1E02|nr:non-specific lipid-transfer protein 2P-like [Olea europaea var. sylvestris]